MLRGIRLNWNQQSRNNAAKLGNKIMRKIPRILKGLLIIAIVTLLSVGLFYITHPSPQASWHSLAMQLPKILAEPTSSADSDDWKIYHVKRGDTLSLIFKKFGLSEKTLLTVAQLKNDHLRSLRPDEDLSFLIKNKKLVALKYAIDFERDALITIDSNNKAKLDIKKKPIDTSLLFKSATIDHSLQDAAYRSGITPHLLAQLEHIFQGSINFSHDIHKGDHFAILYKEYYVNGKKYHPGNIMAAEFITREKKYQAIRFTDPDNHTGYYTPLGHAVEALFLRFPVRFTYISGRFTYHRLDPYLHQWRTHLGIDLAANRGTPIRSIGNGRIVFIGHDGGYGNCIKIRYGRHYEGLYGHMYRFAHGLKLHQYVKRGQIIGYVGATGWATGPHLHFSFFVNGIPRNWLSFHLPRAEPISHHYLKKFKDTASRLLNTMALYEHEQ